LINFIEIYNIIETVLFTLKIANVHGRFSGKILTIISVNQQKAK